MSAGEQRDGEQNRQPVRLALPRAVLRHRERAGIYCQPNRLGGVPEAEQAVCRAWGRVRRGDAGDRTLRRVLRSGWRAPGLASADTVPDGQRVARGGDRAGARERRGLSRSADVRTAYRAARTARRGGRAATATFVTSGLSRDSGLPVPGAVGQGPGGRGQNHGRSSSTARGSGRRSRSDSWRRSRQRSKGRPQSTAARRSSLQRPFRSRSSFRGQV